MKTKSKIILMGLLTTTILLVTTAVTFCAQLSENTWTRLEGVAEKSTRSYDVAVDKDGNSYMIGDVGSDDTGVYGSMVSKYAADGTKLWTKKFGSDVATTSAQAVALDSAGNCYVTGVTEGKIDGLELIGMMDAFIVKYKPDGTKEWLKLIGVPDAFTNSIDIAIDKLDNFYITGSTDGNLNNQVLTGDIDLFIAMYNSAGVHQWTKLLGAAEKTITGCAIAVDNNYNIYVAGYTDSGLDGQNIKIPSDGLVVKYDSKGNKKWTRLVGAVGTGEEVYAIANSIALDSNGNSFIAGETNGQIDDKAKIGSLDTFIIAYTPDGNKLWSKLLGVKKADTGTAGIVIDSLNNLYISGYTDGLLGQAKIGKKDGFVAKYNAATTKEWIKQFGVTNGIIVNRSIAIDKNNLLYVVGSTNVALDGQSKIGLTDAFITTYFNK